ncbi:MAG: dienelactone hydrolase family protein [Candidatus Thermochlorobacter sp.]
MTSLLGLCIGLGGEVVSAQEVYAQRESSTLGYLAVPKVRSAAAVVFLHDNYGLDSWTKSLCDVLAREGFIVLAVDLYRTRVPQDFMEAHELERALPESEAQQGIAAAVKFLKEDLKVKRIGIVGIAMGGALALDFVANRAERDIAALVVNYAALPTEIEKIKKLVCPIMAHFGENDVGIDQARVLQFTQMLQAHNKTVDVKVYPKAAFGFLRPTTDSYHAESADDAWARTRRFLKTHLQSKPKP